MIKRVILIVIVFICSTLPLIMFEHDSFAQLSFGTPTANTNISALVPVDVAQKIARKRAHDLWGQTALGTPLPCVDDDGDIVAYMFPVVIGQQSFPTQDEISKQIQYGRAIAQKGFDVMNESDKQKVRDHVKNKGTDLAINGSSPFLSNSSLGDDDKGELDKVARRSGRGKMVGADQYGTIIVSARYDRFPVPYYTNYLPPYYFQGDLAITAANTAAKSSAEESVTLERIFFLQNLHAQYFDFSLNGKHILMNAHSLNIESAEAILTRKGKKVVPDPDMLSEITREWAKVAKDIK